MLSKYNRINATNNNLLITQNSCHKNTRIKTPPLIIPILKTTKMSKKTPTNSSKIQTTFKEMEGILGYLILMVKKIFIIITKRRETITTYLLAKY